ncbi:flavodoxin family protein [Frisingicoccus sp.]|uniref:flavodoxin family protein n=1 Tax=Frisingicoccus sp. TaxID=1918627 RepID=UPI002EB25128|nr:hypothetical protein [Frisingicoccus sp.]
MNIIVSFSGRKNGNSDTIAKYIAKQNDTIIYMRELSIQPCANCEYECFKGNCIYKDDGIYTLFDQCFKADKVFFIVPMYCGNPSALYFILNERSQGYFKHNEEKYNNFIERLYVIGIYGNSVDNPEFEQLFVRNYAFNNPEKHILGLERHKYGQKMKDFLLVEDEVEEKINRFMNDSSCLKSK